MATFTSSLSDQLLEKLAEKSEALHVPKNKLIEIALRLYFEHLERAEYIQSYRQASQDKDVLLMAEEGMAEYLKQWEK